MRSMPGLRQVRGLRESVGMRAARGGRRPASGASPSDRARNTASALAPTRHPRHVEGVVTHLEQRAVSQTVPAFVAIVRDARSEETKLIWLGRTVIRGIEVGSRMRASGLATTLKAIPAIYNPSYDLLPSFDDALAARAGGREARHGAANTAIDGALEGQV